MRWYCNQPHCILVYRIRSIYILYGAGTLLVLNSSRGSGKNSHNANIRKWAQLAIILRHDMVRKQEWQSPPPTFHFLPHNPQYALGRGGRTPYDCTRLRVCNVAKYWHHEISKSKIKRCSGQTFIWKLCQIRKVLVTFRSLTYRVWIDTFSCFLFSLFFLSFFHFFSRYYDRIADMF